MGSSKDQIKNGQCCAEASTNKTSSIPLFQYAKLPNYELYFYITFVIAAISYGWYMLIEISYDYGLNPLIYQPKVNYIPWIGYRIKDESNWEWIQWSKFAIRYLPYMIAHSVLFNFSSKFFSETVQQYFVIIYSLIFCVIIFKPQLVLLTIVQGSFVFMATNFIRHSATVWLSVLPLLYQSLSGSTVFMVDNTDSFKVIIFVSYTIVSYISYNLEFVKNDIRKEDDNWWKRYSRMLFYTFYLPYMISLIMIYPEFEKRMREKNIIKRSWKEICIYTIRIVFWWSSIELLLHFCYFEAILYDTYYVTNLSKNKFIPLGMALGTFFHVKYVVIFGYSSVFAMLDNMQPFEGPICISRVTLYSKIWRYFDRGLYSFFKTYIFLPICQPTFSIKRRIFGVLISYSFVLMWHGIYYHNIVWILLNIAGLFVEYAGKGIYTIQKFRKWREKNIANLIFRRILAFLQLVPFIIGAYSNFYFLGGRNVGDLFVQRIWYEETLTLRYPLFILLSLGYCYTQIIIEIEYRKQSKKFD